VKQENTDNTARESLPRIAASSYLNTAPLIWSFARGARRRDVRLLTDTAPARCADMLARGEADAALVPVIEYQRLPEVEVVPGVCVGARGDVRSVVLVTRGAELKDVRTIALDISSRTSSFWGASRDSRRPSRTCERCFGRMTRRSLSATPQ